MCENKYSFNLINKITRPIWLAAVASDDIQGISIYNQGISLIRVLFLPKNFSL